MPTFHELIEEEINRISDLEIKDGLLKFNDYFIRVWMNNKYLISDWNQTEDLRFRSNNWAESFHSSFGKRFYRSHPNIYISIEQLISCSNASEFNYNDYLLHPHMHISHDSNQYTLELHNIIQQRTTTYAGDKSRFLLALASIEFRIMLKIEKEVLLNCSPNS